MSKPLSPGLLLWHGAHRWEGSPQVRGHKEGNYECGPGIYLTTNLQTARKYAKGGGSIMEMTLDPGVNWLEDAKIARADMEAFVRSVPRLKHRRDILDDIARNAEMHNSDRLGANVLINLGVNHRSFAGEPGVAVADFLASRGIQASLYGKNIDEDWVIVFDPKIICRVRKVPAAEQPVEPYLPKVHDQLRLLRAQHALGDVHQQSRLDLKAMP